MEVEPSDNQIRSYFVVLMVLVFGAGSWITVNGLFVELPLFVALGIPEGYNLASYLVVIIQLANVGPLIFTITTHCLRGNKLEVPTIYLSLAAGVLSCVLLVFFWDTTTYWPVFGEDRSTPLLALSFVLALVNCTSSVTFIPFMVRLKSSYMTWFFVGQGFSALGPSLVALGQGVGNQICVANHTYTDELSGDNCTTWTSQMQEENFPPENFFGFLCSAMSLSLLAFICLHKLPLVKKEYACQPSSSETEQAGKDTAQPLNRENGTIKEYDVYLDGDKTASQKYSRGEYAFLFIILAMANALSNGILPAIQSYSCGAYGLNAYLLAATLGNVANPIGCLIVMFFPLRSLALVTVVCLIGLLTGGYCLATALLSPEPPLQNCTLGIVLVVLAWIVVSGVLAYVKASIGWMLRNEPNNHKLLTWYGIVTQIGSLIGAFIMFPLINVASLFVAHYSDPCEGYPTYE